MAINQELLEGYKQMQRELQVANQKLQQYERSYMGMRQDLLNLKASVESLDDADALLGSSAVAVTAQAQQAASTSGKGSGRGFADGIPGGCFAVARLMPVGLHPLLHSVCAFERVAQAFPRAWG